MKGYDNDEDDIVLFGPSIVNFLATCATDSDCDGDMAHGSKTLQTDLKTGPAEAFTEPFGMSAFGDSLKFKVHGKLQVTYP